MPDVNLLGHSCQLFGNVNARGPRAHNEDNTTSILVLEGLVPRVVLAMQLRTTEGLHVLHILGEARLPLLPARHHHQVENVLGGRVGLGVGGPQAPAAEPPVRICGRHLRHCMVESNPRPEAEMVAVGLQVLCHTLQGYI